MGRPEMAHETDYRNYPGMDFAEIPSEILDRNTNDIFADRDMGDDARAVKIQRDAAYNNRWAVPNHQADLDRWAADSAAVRNAVRCDVDILYGDGSGRRHCR